MSRLRASPILALSRLLSCTGSTAAWRDWAAEFARRPEDWLALCAYANRQWLSGPMALTLRGSPLLDELDDAQLRLYLADMANAFDRRGEMLREECVRLVRILSETGTPVLLFKGSADLFNGLDEPRGRRSMTDLDVLLPETAVRSAWQGLREHGYRLFQPDDAFRWESRWHHAPPLVSPAALRIELHRWPLDADAMDLMGGIENVWRAAIPLVLPGNVQALRLPPTLEAIQRIAHAQLHHYGHERRTIELRHLYHTWLFMERFGSEIDWPWLAARFRARRLEAVLHAFLVMQRNLFAYVAPLELSDLKSAQAHWAACLRSEMRPAWQRMALHRLRLLSETLEQRRLLDVYGDDVFRRTPLWRLRARRCASLVRRYCHLSAWRAWWRINRRF